MLKWTAIFLVIVSVATIFDFTGVIVASIAKTIFFIFIVLVVIFGFLGLSVFKK